MRKLSFDVLAFPLAAATVLLIVCLITHVSPTDVMFSLVGLAAVNLYRRRRHAALVISEKLPFSRYPLVTFALAVALIPVGRVTYQQHRQPEQTQVPAMISSDKPGLTPVRTAFLFDLFIRHEGDSDLSLFLK